MEGEDGMLMRFKRFHYRCVLDPASEDRGVFRLYGIVLPIVDRAECWEHQAAMADARLAILLCHLVYVVRKAPRDRKGYKACWDLLVQQVLGEMGQLDRLALRGGMVRRVLWVLKASLVQRDPWVQPVRQVLRVQLVLGVLKASLVQPDRQVLWESKEKMGAKGQTGLKAPLGRRDCVGPLGRRDCVGPQERMERMGKRERTERMARMVQEDLQDHRDLGVFLDYRGS